jgi:hypothetical protein
MDWHMDRSKTNTDTGAGVQRWGCRRRYSFDLALHIKVLQAEIYTTKSCVMGNIQKDYTDRNICTLSDSKPTINSLDNFHINSKLVRLSSIHAGTGLT